MQLGSDPFGSDPFGSFCTVCSKITLHYCLFGVIGYNLKTGFLVHFHCIVGLLNGEGDTFVAIGLKETEHMF